MLRGCKSCRKNECISEPGVSCISEVEEIPYQIKGMCPLSPLLNKVRQILMHQSLPERSNYIVFLI